MDAKSISELISDEHPQIIAVILSYLESAVASDVLSQLDQKIQPDIIYRLSTLENIQPEALKELELVMERKFNSNDWVLGIGEIMTSFGEFNERIEIFRNFTSNPSEIDPMLASFPDGYYAEFQYESNYKHTLNHSERLILQQDHKRKWRILEYSYEFVEGEGYSEEKK